MALEGPVVVGTDLSPASEEAMRQGAQLAHALEARLIVAHVVPELLPDGSVFAPYRDANLNVQETVLDKARAALQDAIDRVLGDVGPIDLAIESGSPHVGLLRQLESLDAKLVALGPGATAMDVARHTQASVLLARPSPAGPVIAATDFSAASRPAVEVGASEARRRGVALHLVHAFDIGMFAMGQAPAPAVPYLVGANPLGLEGLDDLQAIATSHLRQTLEEFGMSGEVSVIPGRPAGALVRHAETIAAGLMVVGTHGRSGLSRLTMGSTAARVAETAPCSVLIVR